MQKAFALLGAGLLLVAWLFLLLITPLLALILMLAAVTWRDYRRRRPAVASRASRQRLLRVIR